MEGDPLLQVGSSVNSSPTATKTTTWVSSASLIVANMLGAGVLGLPFAVKGMGWAGAVVVLVFMTCMSIFGGLQLGSLRGNDSSVTTYAALARRCASKCWGPRAAKTWSYFVSTIGYTYILGTCTIYLITMKISVMEVLQKCEKPHPGLLLVQATNTTNTCSSSGCSSKGVADLHDLVWLFIVCALVYPLTYLRSLADAAWVSYVGVATIVVVNSVILVYCVIDATHHKHHSSAPSEHRTFEDFINGLTQLAFAYGGHVLMVEIQSVMRTPTEFSKSVYLSQLVMFANYAIIGLVGYAAYGDDVKSPITLNLPDNALRAFTNVCLFVHVMMAYAINSQVLTEAIVSYFRPGFRRDRGRAAFVRWGMGCTGIMIAAIIISIVIPFFSSLMNIYSSIGIFSLSFAVPASLWLLERQTTVPRRMINVGVILFSIAACGLGVWAATKDIIDQWHTCHYTISV
eukprot:m.80099 g.80099  ORF g.80099 m.80099 type:complete len:458 (+) comp14651_c0_seq2:303-1676(+)